MTKKQREILIWIGVVVGAIILVYLLAPMIISVVGTVVVIAFLIYVMRHAVGKGHKGSSRR